MSYWVRRNANGRIEAAADRQLPGYDEEMVEMDAELSVFLYNTPLPTGADAAAGLRERRARAAERDGSVEGRIKAINLRMEK